VPAPQGYPLEQFERTATPPPRDSPARRLAEASAEASAIRELARAEGAAEGLREGRAAGRAQVDAAARALDRALVELRRVGEQHACALEREAVELALALAAKILGGALQAQPERVLDVLAGALRRVGDRRRVTILVNPADLALVREALDDASSELAGRTRAAGVEQYELQADRRVDAGGVVVRTRESEVDASVLTQLDRAREVVRDELRGEER
jgi:flagellar assembly protein FliH